MLEHTTDMERELIDSLRDELDDIIKYNRLYKEACDHHDYELADMLEDISADEYTHATELWRHLSDNGIYDPHKHIDIEEKWHTVKQIFNIE